MATLAPIVTFNSGATMPVFGMGTGSHGSQLSNNERKEAILTAIEVGYRHFDTTSIYGSEGFLGEAIKESIDAGFVKRDDLFITSKLFWNDCYPKGVLPAIRKSLSALQLDYLDLYLIHWPVRVKEDPPSYVPIQENILPIDMKGTWQGMESFVKQGLSKSIGVSNFSSKKILDLCELSEILPAVNQVEMHPKWQQKKLRETCQKFNVHVCAWSPLGAPSLVWGSPNILNDPTIKEVAVKHGKSPAHVTLRWGLNSGVTVIPKSFNENRIKENFDVFSWNVDEEDRQKIDRIEHKKNFDGSFISSPNGPYKTLDDLWDGEI